MPFELIHKPTFTNQLLTIPKEWVIQILEKIEVLRDDPKPHGNLKKKLHGYKGDIYRLRSGDFRIIYTYGDGWVALLGVDARKDIYKGDKLVAAETGIDTTAFSQLDDLLTPNRPPAPTSALKPKERELENLLPVELTEELLDRLLIPKTCFAALLTCRTFDDLLEADIPGAVRDRLFDCITAPNFDQVLSQPSFVTGSPDDLLRFKEGDLLGFLLKLNPEQEKFVTWAINATGPTLLKGGPGTGKSTVALYRTREILQQIQSVPPTPAGSEAERHPRILFTTYTNALVTFSEQLLQQLLGAAAQFVEVKTADALIYALVCHATGKPKIAAADDLLKIVKQAIPEAIAQLEGNILQQQTQRLVLQQLQPNYLVEEIDLIDSRGITTLAEYETTARTGRMISLNKLQRQAIWQLRSHFNQLLLASGLETWAQLRNRAIALLENMEDPPVYDAVLIDEAQDLPPNTLRFLTQICRAPNRFFVTADANQSIYGNGFRWSEIHQDLKFVGRTGILRVNHRTTLEINEAARSYLQEGLLDEEAPEQQYIHTGPPPAVRAVSDKQTEVALLTQFCRTATREFRFGIEACAILTPTEKAGKNIAGQLTHLGIDAQYMSSRELDLNRKGVKVLTLKAAKGLEFPIVAIAGFLESKFPYIPKGTLESAKAEILTRERRTLFVGMTRAMRALLIVVPSQKPGILLENFDAKLWNLGNPAA